VSWISKGRNETQKERKRDGEWKIKVHTTVHSRHEKRARDEKSFPFLSRVE
jgi:hypothetical protein